MRKINFLILLALGSFFACTSENPIPDENSLGYQYYPLQVGDSNVYQVQLVEYKLSGFHDTIQYQLMEVVADTFQNLQGNTSYSIERYKKGLTSTDWEIDSLWTARLEKYSAILVENNNPLIKLSFPVENNKRWDVNALNAKEENEYTMRDVFSTFVVNDTLAFDRTLTVIQENIIDNVLFQNVAKEVYQEEVGLVYKEQIIIYYCADVDCLGQEEIESGYNYKQILISNE